MRFRSKGELAEKKSKGGGEGEAVAKIKQNKSLIIPSKTIKPLETLSTEKASCDSNAVIDEDKLFEKLYLKFKEKLASEENTVVAINCQDKDEEKQRQILAENELGKKKADLDARFASIPSIVFNCFNNHYKALISNKDDIQRSIVIDSSPQKYSSIDFTTTLLELLPICANSLKLTFPDLSEASSAHIKAIQANRKNNRNEPSILDIYRNEKDKRTYNLLLNLRESVCTGRKNRNVTTNKEPTDLDCVLTERKVINLSDTRSFSSSHSEERIVMIDLFRVLLLSAIRPIWQSEMMLKYFSVLDTMTKTSFSDKPEAFGFIVESIGNAIHSMIGFSDFETYTIVDVNGKDYSSKTFALPTKEDYQHLIAERIKDHFHRKRKKISKDFRRDASISIKSNFSTTVSNSDTNCSHTASIESAIHNGNTCAAMEDQKRSINEDVTSSISKSTEPKPKKQRNEISMSDILGEE